MRTAERAYFDDADQRYLFARSMAPYVELARSGICRGARVLDAGCGAGSGSALLSRAGASVDAVDFSYADVLLTHRACGEVRAVTADVCRLPFADESFDLVVSCHVLEHLDDPRRYLREIRRVLDPKGRLWLITPNRLFSSPDGPPKNPFHVKEYWFDELAALVSEIFPAAEYLGVTHEATGGVIQAEQARSRWHSLDRFRIRRFAPSSAKRFFRRLTGAVYPAELTQVDASDFRIQAIDPRTALDFVAIGLPEG